MSRLPKFLVGSLVAAISVSAGTIGLTSVVQYKPYGVPDHRREEYDATIAKLTAMNLHVESAEQTAKVAVDNKVHDFGMLDPHTTAKHSFQLTNIGDAPLKLEVIDSTCKCTVGKLNSRFVTAGKSTQVTLTWNTGYQAETYEQSVLLKTNDPSKKTMQLTVRGEVRAELIVPKTVAFQKCDVGTNAEAEFIVYSQIYDELEISDLNCDLRDFNWDVTPVDVFNAELGDADAKTAWKVKLYTYREDYDAFNSDIQITVRADKGETMVRTISVSGNVRGAISFQSPAIHNTAGLDLGTIVSGKRRDFHLTVRSRSPQQRELAVLDAKPKELQLQLVPQKTAGTYRLTITVPENCPRVLFSADEQHGYVQVGDPNDTGFSSWFPLRGSVVDLRR